jgi:hypothetical protein
MLVWMYQKLEKSRLLKVECDFFRFGGVEKLDQEGEEGNLTHVGLYNQRGTKLLILEMHLMKLGMFS